MWLLGEEEDGDASEPLAAAISVGCTGIVFGQLEQRPPIMAEREGKATSLAMTQTQSTV